MITPVQQTPIPLDPMRQQITPAPPIAPPAPARLPDTPVQAADSAQDKFNPKSEDNRGQQYEQELTDQQRTDTMSKLRAAYLRLHELQHDVNSAFAAGDASRAKELAAEAAEVAQTIPASVGILQLSAQDNESAPSASGGGNGSDAPQTTSFDIARAGLGAAKEVIEIAASIPYHPVEDRIAINGMRHQILDAMAGVEDIAAKVAAPIAAPEDTPHIDFKA